jgi:hypothetical protein
MTARAVRVFLERARERFANNLLPGTTAVVKGLAEVGTIKAGKAEVEGDIAGGNLAVGKGEVETVFKVGGGVVVLSPAGIVVAEVKGEGEAVSGGGVSAKSVKADSVDGKEVSAGSLKVRVCKLVAAVGVGWGETDEPLRQGLV